MTSAGPAGRFKSACRASRPRISGCFAAHGEAQYVLDAAVVDLDVYLDGPALDTLCADDRAARGECRVAGTTPARRSDRCRRRCRRRPLRTGSERNGIAGHLHEEIRRACFSGHGDPIELPAEFSRGRQMPADTFHRRKIDVVERVAPGERGAAGILPLPGTERPARVDRAPSEAGWSGSAL